MGMQQTRMAALSQWHSDGAASLIQGLDARGGARVTKGSQRVGECGGQARPRPLRPWSACQVKKSSSC